MAAIGRRTVLLGALGALGALAALTAASIRPAGAMTFNSFQLDDGQYVILGTGSIVPGDRVRLVTAMDGVPIGQRTFGLSFNSPGGSVIEAEKMAVTIRSSGLTVIIVNHAVCASACFLLFAAAPKRAAAADARIGVHSVSENSGETLASMGFTTAFARDAAAYGVPSAILGRMVTTEPGQMAWLSTAELASMGTLILPATGSPSPPQQQLPQASRLPDTPVAMASQGITGPSLGFQQGAADRRGWEAWMASLSADAHAGADYWAGQRSLKKPGSCSQPPDSAPQDVASWSGGCMAAQGRLRISDQRRKTEPDYRAGWNSL